MTGSRSHWTAAALAAAVALAVLLSGCEIRTAGAPASHPATSASPAAAAQPTAAATPETAAAARSAAQAMFDLYAAQQYAAVYPLLSAQARAVVPKHKWVAVHVKCPPQAAGLTYKVGKPVMAGTTAVMSVSLAGVASSLGSEEESFVYQDGGWFWAPSASDIVGYRGTVAEIVAARKAAGECG